MDPDWGGFLTVCISWVCIVCIKFGSSRVLSSEVTNDKRCNQWLIPSYYSLCIYIS